MSRLVILGRDGVINRHLGHAINHPDAWQPLPGSLEAIARLNQAGVHVAVATNQPGLASGELDLDTLNAIHHKLHDALDRLGGQVAAIACCPHAPDSGCPCRKPEIGMFEQLAERFGVTVSEVVVIGATDADIEAAQRFGAFGVRVLTGAHPPSPETTQTAIQFDNLADAAYALLKEE